MELWIRSQDKTRLIKVSNVQYTYRKGDLYSDVRGKHYIGTYYDNLEILGKYATKERALEVLDEIHKCIVDKEVLDGCNNILILANKNTLNEVKQILDRAEKIAVYEMPLE